MPITPGAAGTSFDVLLAFSLDAEANRRVQQGVSTLEAELKRIQEEAKGVGEEYEKSGEKVKRSSKDTASELQKEARIIKAEIASMTSDVRNLQIGLLRDVSASIASISTKALVTGGAIIGGIFAEVNRYAQAAPNATRETRAWVAATEDLGKARARVDQELIKTALPLLQQAARLATQAAGIVERHPEITNIALKAGTILAGVGVIGLAVSRGIKLVADIQYLATIPTQLTAAHLQDLAADKQLAAAKAQLAGAGGNVPGGSGIGGKVGGIALGVTGIAAAVGLVLSVSRNMDVLSEKLVAMGGAAAGLGQGIAVANHGIFPAIKNILGLGDAAKKTGDDVSQAIGKIRGADNEAAIVEAFASWKEDDARIIKEASEERKKIISEGEREIANITRNYANDRVQINKRFNDSRRDIVQDFESSNLEAERNYQETRTGIVQDAAARLQEMEESHFERLRQLRRESEDRLEELAASRDALGLVREQRRLAEAESEENRSFRLEQVRARKETEQRLAELDSQYTAERERRRAQYEQDIRDNEAQRAEELARAAEGYQQEVRQAREAQGQKLRDLQEGLNAERIRRREVFLEQIRDLDASLLGERSLRQKYYNEMLQDAERFFAQYRATMPSGSAFSSVTGSAGLIPIRDGGGYAGRGIYGIAMNGVPEYVLSGNTTRAAERAIGSSLSERSLGNLFNRLGDMRAAVYNDNRRMEVPLSKDMKGAYQRGAVEALEKILGVR